MNRIDAKFRELRRLGKKAFIAYITAGDPGLEVTGELVLALERSGTDIIELGIPFSDPLADGPVIQAASSRALKRGANLKKIFLLVAALRKKTGIPIVFMTYYNPVMKYGLEKFAGDCALCGVDGVIVPDLPCGEAYPLSVFLKRAGIAMIFLAAPTSTAESLRVIADMSHGFIYYVSLTGVTGARKNLPAELSKKVKLIKYLTDKPVAIGFGVSTPSQAEAVAGFADGVIVGSAIVKVIENNIGNKGAIIKKVSKFAKSLSEVIHG